MGRRKLLIPVAVAAALVVAMTFAAAPSGADNPHGGPPGQLQKQPPTAECDPIDTLECLTPFPDDFFTTPDPSKATGHHLNYPRDMMPANAMGVHVDPTDINRSDGFSPGSTIIVRVPGIDLAQTGAAPITDIARSLDPNAPIVLLDTDTGERVPYWAELDTWNPDQSTRALVVRPARNFAEGHHIVVALRNVKDASGNVIPATPAFAQFRDHRPSFDPVIVQRRKAMNTIFSQLQRAGVRRQSLYLAWDFTVGSEQNLAGAMLHMRDDAYAQLGSGVPAVTVTHVDQNPNGSVLRRVQGTFDVPLYMTDGGAAGGRLVLGSDGLPVSVGTFHAEFRCLIPDSSVGSDGRANPARGLVYGHGLLGGTNEIEGFAPFINQYDIVICATPEIGMASDDVPNIIHTITDFSTFGSVPDRLQQGMLNMQFLARLMNDPRGFGANPAFQVGTPAASPLIPNDVFYNGNSQGGIFGGAATAISKEWTRAVLGVPGMNYSVLLPRSVDFDPFLALLKHTYPDASKYTLGVAMNQILWDRGEPDGYAQHLISDPYPGTPNHEVMMIEAFGDHQVANISTETEARTIGAFVRQPAIAPGRSNDVTPMWGIPPVPSSPFAGSVLELWDFGTPAPPIESLPPEPPQFGSDPHGAARNVPAVRDQVSQFLQPNGAFVDECGSDPCHP
jgi:hypothetical protein